MNRKGETIALSVLYVICGTVFFLAVPKFIPVYADLYEWQAVGLPRLTRWIIGVPAILWLTGGVLAAGSILVLNQRRNSLWINLGFFIGLIVVGVTAVTALFLPLVVDITVIAK